MAQAAKRADRATTEGRVGYRLAEDGSKGTMVAVGCETEPVSKNEEFQAFAETVLDRVDAEGIEAAAELDEERTALVGASSARTSASPARPASRRSTAAVVAAYAHPPANKLGVLVQVRGGDADFARKLAMHISCVEPAAGSAARTCPPTRSRPSARSTSNSDEVQSKPEQAREKIVDGMLNKRFFGAQRARRAGMDPRQRQDRRPGARRGGSRGARVPAVLARRMTVRPEETVARRAGSGPARRSGGSC